MNGILYFSVLKFFYFGESFHLSTKCDGDLGVSKPFGLFRGNGRLHLSNIKFWIFMAQNTTNIYLRIFENIDLIFTFPEIILFFSLFLITYKFYTHFFYSLRCEIQSNQFLYMIWYQVCIKMCSDYALNFNSVSLRAVSYTHLLMGSYLIYGKLSSF